MIKYTFEITLAVLIVLIFLTGFIYVYYIKDRSRKFETIPGALSIAIDPKNDTFYALAADSIGKFGTKDSKNGKNDESQLNAEKLPFTNITCAKIINGDLVIVDDHSVYWLDPDTYSVLDSMDVNGEINGEIDGDIYVIDHAFDKWWLCTADAIYCYNLDWYLEGYWKMPNEIQITGGGWVDGKLYLCSGDTIHLVGLGVNKINAEILETMNSSLGSIGRSVCKCNGKKQVWGFSLSDRNIVETIL